METELCDRVGALYLAGVFVSFLFQILIPSIDPDRPHFDYLS